MTAYAIKAEVDDLDGVEFDFPRQKTMYGGRAIAAGDEIFVFASEIGGGPGLIARGIVTAAQSIAGRPGVARQTPRVSIRVRRVARATRRLDRAALKNHCTWDDGRPETELNFKFYRQATNKIAGISEATAKFLRGHFEM